MTPPRRERVWALFDQAVDLPPHERDAFLHAVCGEDAGLRAEVESLLAHDDGLPAAGGEKTFLKSPLLRPPEGPALAPPAGAAAELPSLARRIGHYRVLRELGAGGMGTVYEAEQDNPRRAVALKVIRAGLASPGLVKRFTYEAQILARLHHPGIAQIYEAGLTEEGQPYFAMELIRGISLDQYVRDHSLDVPTRLGLFARVCDAVQHAHDKGVIHRDLKPGNILVDESGQPRVLDFGVARATDADLQTTTGRTEIGQLLGTLNYMSPEQIAADPALIDPRSDVYTLGVILFELLADRLPYHLAGLSLPEAARVIRDQDPSALGSINTRLRGDVETIVAKALEKDRTRRYASAGELAADVRRHLNHEPIRARPASAAYLLRKFTRRHKALVGGVAGIMAALVLGLLGTIWFALGEADQRRRAEAKTQDEIQARNQAEQNRREARRSLYIAEVSLAQQAWERGQTYLMRDLLEEAARGQPGDEDVRGFEWHFLWRKAHPDVRTLRGHEGWVTGVAFSPDGRFLASAGWDSTVRVWEAADGRLLRTLKGHGGEVTCVCFSPDGQRLASGASDEIRLWDVSTGGELLRWGTSTRVVKVAFSPDGQRLVSAGMDGIMRVWESSSGKEIFRVSAHQGGVHGVAFSPDGRWIASAGADGMARVWNARDGKFLLLLAGHTGTVADVTYSPNGQRLATAGRDGTARVWDALSGKPLVTFTGHRDMVWSVAFSPDGTQLASAGDDRTVRVWDPASGAEGSLLAHSVKVASVAFSPDGARIASADADAAVRLWELTSPNAPAPLKGHTGLVLGVAFSPDGQRLASASLDCTVRLWQAFGGKEIATLQGHPGSVRGVAFSPVGELLASAGDDKGIRIWDASDGRPLRTLSGPTVERVHGVAFDPGGGRLASAGQDGTVRLWDVPGGQEVLTLRGHTGAVLGVAFSADGQRLASAGEDRTVRLWDAVHGELLLTLKGHGYAVNSVAFAPGGRHLASAGDDSTLRVWDVEDGRELLTLRGHTAQVRCVAFSPDGTRLASTGRDRMVCLWDAASGKQLLTLRGSAEELFSLAFSPDGLWLALAGRDPVVRVW